MSQEASLHAEQSCWVVCLQMRAASCNVAFVGHHDMSCLCSSAAGEPVCAEKLRGALEVVVSGLVDRAFATQTAYVHCAHSLSKQMQALTSLNAHLMDVRQVQSSQKVGPFSFVFMWSYWHVRQVCRSPEASLQQPAAMHSV